MVGIDAGGGTWHQACPSSEEGLGCGICRLLLVTLMSPHVTPHSLPYFDLSTGREVLPSRLCPSDNSALSVLAAVLVSMLHPLVVVGLLHL